MPAAADHAARRDQLAELAIGIIAREGLAGTTIRRLAAEAGFSTAIVTHYFRNKRELLIKIYDHVSGAAISHFRRSSDDPSRSLREVLETFLPIGEREKTRYKVVFAFWQLAHHDGEFAQRQHLAMRQSHAVIEQLLIARGQARDATQLANHLLIFVMGTAIRASFEPDWTDDTQREMLRELLERLGLPSQ